MKDQGKARGLSRRSFLQATAIGLAGIASAGSLGACAKAGSTAGTSTSNVEVNGINYEIINTDLLVIGGGNSAFSIAAQGLAEGQYVTIVDKGVFKHSGTSGMSWDAFSPGIIPDDPSEDLRMSQYFNQQINGDALKNALDFDPEPNKFVYAINHGQTLPDRNEDGTVANYAMDRWCQSLFFRREGDPLSDSQKASIIDRTMITNLLVNEGRCLGAMGIHLPTGEFKVFRAPATVIATGGCTWIYGWFTVAACTIGTADNTADVDMAGYRLGLGIGDAEYCQYDVMSSYPPGLATGFGSGVCGDAQEAHAIVDKNGDPIFDADDKNVLSRVYFNQQMGRIIVEEDRGTENGGVFIDVGNSHLRYSNDRNKAVLAKFGVDVTQEKIEAMPEMYEHGGTPVIDENMMTEFEGLFHARGAGTAGENGGTTVHLNRVFGPYTAHCAVEYAKSADPVEHIDWSPIAEEFERLHEIRTRESSSGLAPHKIRKKIQYACKDSLGVYRNNKNMENALKVLEEVRTQDLPNMSISDTSPLYNTEWKEAIEAYNMLDIAEISVRSSLKREETRGMYLRAEHPEKDDENWACMLVCRDNSGEMEFEKLAMPRSSW